MGKSYGMRISVKLFSILREGRNPEETHEIRSGATVSEVVTELGIAEDQPLIIFVNGRHAQMDTPLNEGDRLAVFPPIAGG